MGESASKSSFIKSANKYLLKQDFPKLSQKLAGIEFDNPIGLAAGFDYEAQLTQLLPTLGFGLETVGTITNMNYEGNPPPRLGRLPRSKSLMVNKGFKSSGAKAVSKRLTGLDFEIPIGISIGRTNSPELKTQKDSIKDIISAFIKFEISKVKHSYYELNISCPNLIHGNISFYPPKNLKELLIDVDKLKLKLPVFVKMPIIKSDKETLKMLDVISKYSPKGVIFGNLQNNRNEELFHQDEVKYLSTGNFSGKPTYNRSNELIKLAYKYYKDRFTIVGCGGVFTGHDAFEKIALGASLVQLITGLIFQGPQLASQINFELSEQLDKRGIINIKEAVGIAHE
jgi:dihydroorotate dehydrogenase subfamily 2